jgi:hypothetical protein
VRRTRLQLRRRWRAVPVVQCAAGDEPPRMPDSFRRELVPTMTSLRAAILRSLYGTGCSSTRRMGGYGPPRRVMLKRLSSISMGMVWTVTPPCRSFILRSWRRSPIIGHRTPEKRKKNNEERNDFHFFLEEKAQERVGTLYHRF